MTAVLPDGELMALMELLGKLDYGDAEDEVETEDRKREAEAIFESLLARGWRPPQAGRRRTLVLRVIEYAGDA